MEKFKVNDLFIVRPMRLIKSNSFTSLGFPYDFLAKIGIIDKYEWERWALPFEVDFSKNPITWMKLKAQSKVPGGLYKAAIQKRKESFIFLKDDATLALKVGGEGFKDIFDDKFYQLYFPTLPYRDFEDPEDNLGNRVVNMDDVEPFWPFVFRGSNFTNIEVEDRGLFPLIDEVCGKELAVPELLEFREKVVAENKNMQVTYLHGHSEMFVDSAVGAVCSYMRNGKKGEPVVTNKVRQRRLLFPSRYASSQK